MHLLSVALVLLLSCASRIYASGGYTTPNIYDGFADLLKNRAVTPTLAADALPAGWTLAFSCAVDSDTRILADYNITLSDNTPAKCSSTCAALGYHYAGVEYGYECHCASAYNAQPFAAAPASCNVACAGDASQVCGGTWRIGLYTDVPQAAPIGQNWTLADSYVGPSFLTGFVHEAIGDPTGGRVNYVDQTTALSQNLTFAQGNTFIIRADYKNVIPASGPGRNSVRVRSVKTYTSHLAVFDVRHMPEGCATWPALWWTTESNWPNGGELDIIEGVNNAGPNLAILHTTSGCTMQNNTQTGTSKHWNCDYAVDGNAGCGVAMPGDVSFGPPFNANGGGWFAMERTATYIRVWFWPRDVGAPAALVSGAGTLDTTTFGVPVAYYPTWSGCNLAQYLGDWSLIINLTLCGGWAGNTFNGGGCTGVCDDYVNNNPAAFLNAYWELGFARVYL